MKVTRTEHKFRTPKQPKLFDAIGTQHVGQTLCFLCGKRLTHSNRSDEHVFPKWLQTRYNLWDQKLVLLNGTDISYKDLKIPCCWTCNTKYLSRIETAVNNASLKGPEALRSLSHRTLFIWLAKIMYGILYKEGLLRRNRAVKRSGRIVPRATLESIKMHHYFLQSVRLPMRFVDFFPASIFIFHLQKSNNLEEQFDFKDLPEHLGIAIQFGSLGIIAILQDGGSQEKCFSSFFRRYYRFPLHPVQFIELISMIFYRATLFNRTPKYMVLESVRTLNVMQLPLQGFSLKPIYNDWEQNVYAKYLSFYTKQPISTLFSPPDKVMSWLNCPNGKTRRLDLKIYPLY